MKRLLLLIFFCPAPAQAQENLEEACLLGQETAALFYDLLKDDPERTRSILEQVDTGIAKRAYYWAMVYLEKEQSLHRMTSNYLKTCLKTGPVRIPPPKL